MQHKPVKFYDKYYVARAPSANAVSLDEKAKTSAENLGQDKSGDPDLGLVSFVNKPHADLPKVTCVDEAAKSLTYHIERCTFPPWDGADGTVNIAFPTENELNITLTAPIQDPSLDPIFPHLSLKRAK